MAQLQNISDVINRLSGGGNAAPQTISTFDDARLFTGGLPATPVVGRWSSLWLYAGEPGSGLVPTSSIGQPPSNTTPGSAAQTSPATGQQQWLLGIAATSLVQGTLMLYDRLLHSGGLSAIATGSQTVNVLSGALTGGGSTTGGTPFTLISGGLTRYTGGAGNQIWLEIYTAVGVTPTNFWASYLNQNGNQSITSFNPYSIIPAIGGTTHSEAQRMIPLTLRSGDTGVSNVQYVLLSGSTGTAGNYGVTVIHPLAYVNIGLVGVSTLRDFITGLPNGVQIQPGACLAWAWFPEVATVPQIHAELYIVNE